ncbi:hypothetical protein VT930_11945 [Mycobacterium sherrisii]|uniref:hypothetical protein n=1 Tax=Mycobacterium sherrisii TaxID=243061 RepID=UPI002DDD92BB|nr:hypothetical protein [Mycobacterium sherrisii]MEC4763816.1 hypothetical protein [Mycobacterium sherrisii]
MTDPMITYRQHRMLHALFHDAGVADRDERLAITSQIVGRAVNTSTELTLAEASNLIDELLQWGMPSRRDVKQQRNVTENLGGESNSWEH